MASPGKASRTKFSEDAMLLSLASEAERRLEKKRRERKDAKAAMLERQASLQKKEAQKLSATFKEKAEVEKAVMEQKMNSLLSGSVSNGLDVATDIAQTVAGEKLVSLRTQLDQALQSKVLVESSKSTLRFTIEDLKDRLEEREEELSQATIDLKSYRYKFQQEEGARLLLEKTAEEYSRELESLKKQVVPLSTEVEKLSASKKELEEQVATLLHAEAEGKTAKSELTHTSATLHTVQSENEKLKESNKKLQEEVDKMKEQMKNMVQKSKGGDEDINKLRSQLEDEQFAKSRLERQVAKMQPRIEELEKELAEAEAAVSDLKAEKRKTQKEQRQMQTTITELTTELNLLKKH